MLATTLQWHQTIADIHVIAATIYYVHHGRCRTVCWQTVWVELTVLAMFCGLKALIFLEAQTATASSSATSAKLSLLMAHTVLDSACSRGADRIRHALS